MRGRERGLLVSGWPAGGHVGFKALEEGVENVVGWQGKGERSWWCGDSVGGVAWGGVGGGVKVRRRERGSHSCMHLHRRPPSRHCIAHCVSMPWSAVQRVTAVDPGFAAKVDRMMATAHTIDL